MVIASSLLLRKIRRLDTAPFPSLCSVVISDTSTVSSRAMDDEQRAAAQANRHLGRFSLYPWRSIAQGQGSETVSPIRDYTLICTDPLCTYHYENGEPEPFHRPLQRATALERRIIMAFRGITNFEREVVTNFYFTGWRPEDLAIACERSYNITNINRTFFGSDYNESLMANMVYQLSDPERAPFLPRDIRRNVRYHLSTWQSISRGFGTATVSPIRDYTLICTDPTCALHDADGNPLPQHRPLVRATTVEMMIILSFYDVAKSYEDDRRRYPHWPNWTEHDLRDACEHSDSVGTVFSTFFGSFADEEKMEEIVNVVSTGNTVELIERHAAAGDDAAIKRDIFTDLTLSPDDRTEERGPPFHEFMYTVVTKLLLEYTQYQYKELDEYVDNDGGLRHGRPAPY